MATRWVDVEEARTLPGLRLVLTRNIPNPWAEGAKALFDVKRIPYVAVTQRVMGPNDELQAWTGQASAPVAAYEDEPPRTVWTQILHLAERLAPEPSLIPADAEERARMFGLLHELMGEQGLAWCRRLQMARPQSADPAAPLHAVGTYLEGRYGGAWTAPEVVDRRVDELLAMFAGILRRQYARGAKFFLGDRLSALDCYGATVMALVEPLAPAVCPMMDASRVLYTMAPPQRAAVDTILLEHRDRIYGEYLTLPVQLK
jgi:glutathione S-transferase